MCGSGWGLFCGRWTQPPRLPFGGIACQQLLGVWLVAWRCVALEFAALRWALQTVFSVAPLAVAAATWACKRGLLALEEGRSHVAELRRSTLRSTRICCSRPVQPGKQPSCCKLLLWAGGRAVNTARM